MARGPNIKAEKARQLYKDGLKLTEIASQLDISEGTVRSWKSRYNWDGNNATLQKKYNATQRNKKAKKKVVDDGTSETLKNESLTPEQRLFCIYYNRSFNATQSYLKAYKVDYETANANGPRLLVNARVRKELDRLHEIKRQQIVASESDLVEMHMRIAFADIGDYLSFGQEAVPVMAMYGPVKVKDEETGEQKTLTKDINVVKLKESSNVDTQIIQEVKEGRDGVSIKLADKQKSLDWLDRHFLMNPMDRHKAVYEEAKAMKAAGHKNDGELSKLDQLLSEIRKQAGNKDE